MSVYRFQTPVVVGKAMPKSIIAFVALLACFQFPVVVNAQEALTEGRFEELMTSIVPAEDSRLVDWQLDLLSAQKVAIEEKKPIFIWSMDGHPLGCT